MNTAIKARTTRPRGFMNYRPRAKALALIDETKNVIAEYDDVLPLTLRQIFYVLVTRGHLDKTEKGYKRLIETINKARRGSLIDWDAIRDDGFQLKEPNSFNSVERLFSTFRHTAKTFQLDRQEGQARRLQLWCEAGGMVPQLERVAYPYGIAVSSSGGFDSTTAKHTTGRNLASKGPLTILHLGDYDRSGVHMFSSLDEDVNAFAKHYGGDVDFVRLAVTPEQVADYHLPTAPPKESDRRSFDGNKTTQCEALDPRTLAAIVEAAIQERFDMTVYRNALAEEAEQRERALEILDQIS